ncbi:MAG: PIN domain-containing protein [Thaumarchaeota archaeon]|nr:PIN domain-containing protein [Nitrososphaerota archaeon]
MKEVLDSRFLIEYFYSDKTETKQKTLRKLKELIQRKEGILPTIVICETTQIICQRVGKEEAEICYATLTKSGLHVQNLTAPIAKHAGLLRSKHRNVPMGDCIIAATAIANQARILSDDPHFDTIDETKRTWI